jgi:hypothetical protein
MNRWDLYVTWGMLVIIGIGISSVSRHLTEIQNEIAEIRRKMDGDVEDLEL